MSFINRDKHVKVKYKHKNIYIKYSYMYIKILQHILQLLFSLNSRILSHIQNQSYINFLIQDLLTQLE